MFYFTFSSLFWRVVRTSGSTLEQGLLQHRRFGLSTPPSLAWHLHVLNIDCPICRMEPQWLWKRFEITVFFTTLTVVTLQSSVCTHCVHRESFWHIARLYGIPQQYINIFKSLYLNSSCCVKTDSGLTEFFHIVTGVRQGCVLSPFLFLLVVDFVMRKAIIGPSLGIKWTEETRLSDIDFADDISLLAETRDSLQELTNKRLFKRHWNWCYSPKTKLVWLIYKPFRTLYMSCNVISQNQ